MHVTEIEFMNGELAMGYPVNCNNKKS